MKIVSFSEEVMDEQFHLDPFVEELLAPFVQKEDEDEE